MAVAEYWQCAFIGEGSSDDALAEVLERLMVSLRPGEDVVVSPHQWLEPPASKSVGAKLAALADEPYDLIFVHRDTDARTAASRESRVDEVAEAGDSRVVPVVPVVMTEAWALADLWSDPEFQGWLAARGWKRAGIETISDPKEELRAWLSRHQRTLLGDSEFSALRWEVLSAIDVNGDVAALPAWQRLIELIETAVVATRPHLAP